MKTIFNLGNGIYQNVLNMGMVYNIPGFDLLDFKAKNGLIQEMAKNLPEKLGYNFWIIGDKIDKTVIENLIEKLKAYIKEKFFLYSKITNIELDVNKLEIWFNTYIDELKDIYDNLIIDDYYFAYFLPGDIYGYGNNDRKMPDYKNLFPVMYKELLTNYKVKINNIFSIKNNFKTIPKHPNIFPTTIKKQDIDVIFNKYIEENDKVFLDEIIKKLYYHFLNTELNDKLVQIKKAKEKQSEEDIKKYLLLILNQFINLELISQDLYSEEEYRATAKGNYYFYPNFGYFLKLADITFIGKQGEIYENLFYPNYIKQFLKQELDAGNINFYVIKFFLKKTNKTYNIKYFDEKYIILQNGKKIPLNEDLYLLMQKQEKNNVQWLYGLTLGLYSTNKEQLDYVYLKLTQKLQQLGIEIQLNFYENDDVFRYYNNRLSIGAPIYNALNKGNFLPFVSIAKSMPKKIEARPEMYFGKDIETNIPVMLNPFKDINENKNMLIVGSSGSGKTVFTQQFLLTNHSDKIFVIDPTGTFAGGFKGEDVGVKAFSILDFDYNPLIIDKEFYKTINYPIDFIIEDKINLIFDILDINKEENKYNWKDYLKTLIYFHYLQEDKVNLNTLTGFLKSTIDLEDKEQLDKDLKNFLLQQDVILTQDLFKFYKEKITSLLFTFNSLKTTLIGKLMIEKEKDFMKDLFKERFLIIDVSSLGINDKVNIDKASMSLFLYLLYSFSLYTRLYKALFENNKALYDDNNKLVNTYIVIDEAHLLTKDERFLKKLDADIRIVRNRRAQITLLTQSILDISNRMGKEILSNISIKMFFKKEDILIYKNFLVGENEKEENQSEYTENVLLYINYFIEKLQERLNNERYVFLEYGNNFFINEIKLTKKAKKLFLR